MRLFIAVVGCLLVVASSQSPGNQLQDDTPLSEAEQYLEPYVEQLVSYRDNPIAKRFITLANLVDVVPTWLMDAFVPLLIPDSTLKLPMRLELPIPVPVAGIDGIPPAIAHLEISHISINKLNEFKKLKPIKFQEGTRYTWAGHMIWNEGTPTTLSVGVKLVFFGIFSFPVDVTVTVTSPGVDFGLIVAFDREKMCDVWGHVLQSSAGCAAHPLFVDARKGISGLKLSELTLHASDISLDDVQVPLLPFGLDGFISGLVQEAVNEKKSEILKDLETTVSKAALEAANAGLLAEIPLIHRYYPCDMEAVAPVPEVSEVCFNNNAAFAMTWGYANCPTHEVSMPSEPFLIDQSKCMSVRDIWPDARPGQILRGTVEAIAGMHEIIDPAVRYKPNSNRAVFHCSGVTLSYKCSLESVEPLDPAETLRASELCVLNQAAFVAKFDAKDLRTGSLVGPSEDFPINQKKCLALSEAGGVVEGDKLQMTVHAAAGKDLVLDRPIEFKADAPRFTVVCKGTTLDYHCSSEAFAVV